MNLDLKMIEGALMETGRFSGLTLEPFGTTGNNRVFKLKTDYAVFLVKHYFQHPGDQRDRFAAEHAFYEFVWRSGTDQIPRPFAWLPESRIGVFEFLEGSKPVSVLAEMTRQAAHFFLHLNRLRADPASNRIPYASEACFSLRSHLGLVDARVNRLSGISVESAVDEAAAEFVLGQLETAWKLIKKRIETIAGPGSLDVVIEPKLRCLSPSDFGFHNSIVKPDGRVQFFDFEYAGWDDPAKTVCDFFCQPSIPVPEGLREEFLCLILQEDLFPRLGERVKLLLPLYQIKWCCILLNEFLPVSALRRRFSNPLENSLDRKSSQLNKAVKALSNIRL